MKKITRILLSLFCWICACACFAADKFDVLPDLPEPLASSAAQASSVSTADTAIPLAAQSVGQEPNFISMIFSLIFVILLIYATGILYTKLNKFGIKALKHQTGADIDSRVTVISTTPLGSNKTLHVVELGGKRMLIGASANSIDLIKDLGSYPPSEIEEGDFSRIEIPNIRIPKIEIPKIEIPGFTKVISKENKVEETFVEQENTETENDDFEISEIYEEENPDGIIDKLFQPATDGPAVEASAKSDLHEDIEHKVDPDEFVLYKKYL